MKISLNFLKRYVDIDVDLSKLVDLMNMHGMPVDEVIEKKCEIDNVYIAKILKIEKHPNADKLNLCKVTDGKLIFSVVCGAKNIQENQIVPLAKDGAKLPGNITITKTKIRGIESEGMLCSPKELGLNDDHSGILILPPDKYKLGEKFIPFESDVILNIDITPNRSDLLCALGIARMIAAILNKKLNLPKIKIDKNFIDYKLDINKKLNVIIDEPKKCLRYAVRIIENVTISESPDWLKNILISCDIRPINNIVDITNFVMLELNQPLHAFDYDKLSEKTIIVRNAKLGENIIALDGKKYNLTDDDLVIADAKQPVAIAGVMGGEFFSITNSTKNIVLESAYFLPATIRYTTKKHSINSDSSYRFEHGIDINNVVNALNRATSLIIEMAGGKTSKNYIDKFHEKQKSKIIAVRFERINKVLGTQISTKQVLKYIDKLQFKLKSFNKKAFHIIIPTFRPDIKEEIDVIEEIAQLYGYNNIPLTLPFSQISLGNDTEINIFNNKISLILTKFGFFEVKNYNFTNNKLLKYLKNENISLENAVKLKNPFNVEETYLKTTLIPDLLKNFLHNYNNNKNDIHLFEIANIYSILEKNFIEIPNLGVISGGYIIEPTFNHNKFLSDINYLKSILTEINNFLNTSYKFIYSEPIYNKDFYDICCNIILDGKIVGVLGQIRNDIIYENKIKNKVFCFEINLKEIYKYYNNKIKFKNFSQFPVVKRDLSIIVKKNIPYSEIEKCIWESGQPFLNYLYLYDLYYGEQIPNGHKSLTFTLHFQSKEKTLSEDEVNKILINIIYTLKNKHDVSLRT